MTLINALKIYKYLTDCIISCSNQSQYTSKVITVSANKIQESLSKFSSLLWAEFCQYRKTSQIPAVQQLYK